MFYARTYSAVSFTKVYSHRRSLINLVKLALPWELWNNGADGLFAFEILDVKCFRRLFHAIKYGSTLRVRFAGGGGGALMTSNLWLLFFAHFKLIFCCCEESLYSLLANRLPASPWHLPPCRHVASYLLYFWQNSFSSSSYLKFHFIVKYLVRAVQPEKNAPCVVNFH